MRLDKFISNNTSASRADVRRLLKAGAITVNGMPVKHAAASVTATDQIRLNDLPVTQTGERYYMLHKPTSYICANSDGSYPTVLDLIKQADPTLPRIDELQIAGRLDVDTTGLVLITSDGQWNHRLTSPRAICDKVYRVTLAQPFAEETLDGFTRGMLLHGEKKPTRPAQVQVVDATTVLLTVHEGKYHQVKRMFAATGNRVIALHRLSVGDIQLDTALRPGQFRPLTPTEIESVNTSTAKTHE